MIAFLDGNRLPAGIWSGPGARHSLGAALARLGLRRALLIGSASLLRDETMRAELAAAGDGRVVAMLPTAPTGTTEAAIETAAAEATRLDADGVVSLGGGVAHDMAKAVALTAPAGVSIRRFLARAVPAPELAPPLPVIALPGTFSAAETVPGGAVILNDGGKTIFGHPGIQPRAVLLDGEIVARTPRAILAASGLNAVHHCLEALYALGHHPMSDAWALFAFARLLRHLPGLAPGAEPPTVDALQEMVEASAMSGLAYGISGLGVGHAICHSLAGRWPISHGDANAVILRHSLAFNAGHAAHRLALLGADLPARIEALCATLGTPRTLREAGLPAGQFDLIAADVLADPITATNPRAVDHKAVINILEAAW